MKKLLSLVLAVFILAGCTGSPAATPTFTDAQSATLVALALTSTPTPAVPKPIENTPAVKVVTPPAPDQPVPPPVLTVTPLPPPPIPTTAVPTVPPTFTPTSPPTLTPTSTATVAVKTSTPITNLATDLRSKLGKPTWQDNLDDNNKGNWPGVAEKCGASSVKGGFLSLTTFMHPDCPRMWRLAQTNKIANFYLEAIGRPDACNTMDNFGLFFRIPVYEGPDYRGYQFGVTCNGQYSFFLYQGTNPKGSQLIGITGWKSNVAIMKGEKNSNRLGVLAIDDSITLYVNGVMLETIRNSAFREGHFGVYIESKGTTDYTVRYDEVTYWENPNVKP